MLDSIVHEAWLAHQYRVERLRRDYQEANRGPSLLQLLAGKLHLPSAGARRHLAAPNLKVASR